MRRKKTTPKMPSFITLGCKKIGLRVGTRDLDDDRYGHYKTPENEITLHPDIPQQERGDTVLHEFVHASLHIRGVELSKAAEERVASVLGTDFYELLRRNPRLVAWIMEGCP